MGLDLLVSADCLMQKVPSDIRSIDDGTPTIVLCACDCRATPVFQPQSGYDAKLSFYSHTPLKVYKSTGAVGVSPLLGHAIPMFRAFSPCLLSPNIGRLTVVLGRVRILAILPLGLIVSRL
ncbi:hypothetical protein TNCT_188541 [Trichonephila clavata]|uniref:Uncharacterized protein n=1 Tax=Trichonephila clavata TaxID=2740835 RepID=A0A8X6KQ24_TRICU|nr:hypothetical protein TNCT_188541 [Trichonephila clavata]